MGTSNSKNFDGFPSRVWKKLCNIHVPPRVRLFGWRTFLDILPTREKLSQKRVMLDVIVCLFCDHPNVSLSHNFLFCPFVVRIWSAHPVGSTIRDSTSMSLKHWLFFIFVKKSTLCIEQTLILLWGIWKDRNARLWQDSRRIP